MKREQKKKKPYWYRTGFMTGGRYDWEGEAKFRGYSSSFEMLKDFYLRKHMSVSEISKEINIPGNTIEFRLRKFGLKKGKVTFYERKFKEAFPFLKECLKENTLRKCFEMLGYKRVNFVTGFYRWLVKNKGLRNVGTRKHPKWQFKTDSDIEPGK